MPSSSETSSFVTSSSSDSDASEFYEVSHEFTTRAMGRESTPPMDIPSGEEKSKSVASSSEKYPFPMDPTPAESLESKKENDKEEDELNSDNVYETPAAHRPSSLSPPYPADPIRSNPFHNASDGYAHAESQDTKGKKKTKKKMLLPHASYPAWSSEDTVNQLAMALAMSVQASPSRPNPTPSAYAFDRLKEDVYLEIERMDHHIKRLIRSMAELSNANMRLSAHVEVQRQRIDQLEQQVFLRGRPHYNHNYNNNYNHDHHGAEERANAIPGSALGRGTLHPRLEALRHGAPVAPVMIPPRWRDPKLQ